MLVNRYAMITEHIISYGDHLLADFSLQYNFELLPTQNFLELDSGAATTRYSL